jgi:uncharacterized protein YbaP (TraB family)
MKKKIVQGICLLAVLLNYWSVYSQQTDTGNNKSLLWEISGNHLARPSYLFGTMHLICSGDYIWTNKMKESLSKSDKVCFEMNLNDPKVIMQASEGFMDKSGKKLREYFTPAQYEILKSYFKDSLHMDITLFEQMRPVALQSMLLMFDAQCSNPISYEDSIMKKALRAKKEISGLEDAKEQLAVLNTIPTDTIASEVMDEIQHKDKSDYEYRQLSEAYRQQDLPALYALIANSKDLGDDMGVFLDERNKKWISRIEEKMKGRSVFFAVGAGHLWGDTGVINLLRKAGYTVKPTL